MQQTEVLEFADEAEIQKLFEKQKSKATELRTEPVKARKIKLKALQKAVLAHKQDIRDALYKDFKKPAAEVDMSEIWPVVLEIKHALRNLKKWTKPTHVETPLPFLGTRSKIYYEPKGVVLIIAPWNFPINLTLGPLVSAIAAGNTAIIKPSEASQHSSAIMQKILDEIFPRDEVAMIQGGVKETQHLLTLPFDHIFFTGSPAVGKIVMEAASKNLVPVTLELGGKSPVIIEPSANLKDAAKKIVWGKFMNKSQTCVAPDYILVRKDQENELLNHIVAYTKKYYGESPRDSESYARIINEKHFRFLKDLFDDAISHGAKSLLTENFILSEKYISPVILSNVNFDMKVMQNEIFGPIMPVMTYENMNEVISIVHENPHPLSAYIFSRDSKAKKKLTQEIPAGGICINECVIHFAHMELPFGGMRTSGIGKSHGFYGFQVFSNMKPILKQRVGLTGAHIFYPPYTKRTEKIVDWLIKFF